MIDGELRARIRRLFFAEHWRVGTISSELGVHHDTVRLAIEIARRVIHRELNVDPNALAALVKAALERLQAQEIHRVRVHPSLERLVSASLQQAGRGSTLSVIADAALPPGGILFDISRGTLDASVNTQLEEIERGFADLVVQRRA